jgi:hypothetical protein
MKPIDFVKAVGIAIAVLVVNVLIAILVMLVDALVVEPGHPREFYDAAAQRIAPWCSHIAGTALFLGAGYLFARLRPDRNGFLFVLAVTVSYAIIDSATVGFGVSLEFGLSMLAKLVAGQAGTFVATRAKQQPATPAD